jgi:hypothetical protein
MHLVRCLLTLWAALALSFFFWVLGVEKLTSSVVLHLELVGLGIASGLLGSRKVMVNEYWVHGHLCLR